MKSIHLVVAALIAAMMAAPAAAHSYKVLYSFCAQSNCTDGSAPNSLIADSAGNLYGTVYQGGAKGFGGIFELKRGAGGHHAYKVLYDFCQQTNCVDGGFATGGLILDTRGNLYGTALIGGSQGNGEVFELVRAKTAWRIQILYGFCPQAINCTDGVGPDSGLAYAGEQSGAAYDGASPLFGTTDGGGITGIHAGVAYQIQPGKNGWNYQVIYDFCAQQGCTDGAYPFATLSENVAGTLYGTTLEGGDAAGHGTAFELAKRKGSWTETVLYTFCSVSGCTDGAYPKSGLFVDSAGDLDGTTLEGGASCNPDTNGCGTAYTIVPDGNSSKESVQHTFCTRNKCPDGYNPQGAAAADPNGDIFSVTEYGGNSKNASQGGGTLYELAGSTFTLLHKFCVTATCTDGANPLSGPVRDSAGHLFGTASTGGANGGGVVYEYRK